MLCVEFCESWELFDENLLDFVLLKLILQQVIFNDQVSNAKFVQGANQILQRSDLIETGIEELQIGTVLDVDTLESTVRDLQVLKRWAVAEFYVFQVMIAIEAQDTKAWKGEGWDASQLINV